MRTMRAQEHYLGPRHAYYLTLSRLPFSYSTNSLSRFSHEPTTRRREKKEKGGGGEKGEGRYQSHRPFLSQHASFSAPLSRSVCQYFLLCVKYIALPRRSRGIGFPTPPATRTPIGVRKPLFKFFFCRRGRLYHILVGPSDSQLHSKDLTPTGPKICPDPKISYEKVRKTTKKSRILEVSK